MNLSTTNFRTLALSVCIGLAVTGCGSQQTKPASAMSAAEKAQLAQAQDQVGSIVDSAIEKFKAAEQDQVAIYSQLFFQKAEKDIAKLKDMQKEFNPEKSGLFDSGYSLKDIQEQATEANNNTQKAVKTKQLIITHLKEILDNQQYIEGLDLSKFEPEYKGLQSDVKRLFKDLETTGQFQGLEDDKLKVLNDLRAFEVSVIREKYYSHPQKELDELPEDTLPVTYKEAQKRLTTLSNTIQSTPRAMETIELRQKEALKALARAQNTLKEINWIDENTNKGLEHVVLRYHKPMDRAFPNILKEDHSELIFEDQVSKYSYLVTTLKSSLQKEVSSLDEATIKAEAQKIADQQSAELKKQLEGKHSKALQENATATNEAIAKAKQEEQLRFEEEKKQLAATHKQKLDTALAERNKLQMDLEKASLELTKLREAHRLAQEQLQLKDQELKTAATEKAQPTKTNQQEPKQLAASTASAPKRNSVASAPEVQKAPAPAPKETTPAASDETFSFDFEIEDVKL